jgi:hypothetical protein
MFQSFCYQTSGKDFTHYKVSDDFTKASFEKLEEKKLL